MHKLCSFQLPEGLGGTAADTEVVHFSGFQVAIGIDDECAAQGQTFFFDINTEQLADYSQKLAGGEWILTLRLNASHAAEVEGMLHREQPMIHRESGMPLT